MVTVWPCLSLGADVVLRPDLQDSAIVYLTAGHSDLKKLTVAGKPPLFPRLYLRLFGTNDLAAAQPVPTPCYCKFHCPFSPDSPEGFTTTAFNHAFRLRCETVLGLPLLWRLIWSAAVSTRGLALKSNPARPYHARSTTLITEAQIANCCDLPETVACSESAVFLLPAIASTSATTRTNTSTYSVKTATATNTGGVAVFAATVNSTKRTATN